MQVIDLKRLRKDFCLTQSEVAKKCGYPQSFVSQMENGIKAAPDGFIQKMKESFEQIPVESYLMEQANFKLRKEGEKVTSSTHSGIENRFIKFLMEQNGEQKEQIKELNGLVKELMAEKHELLVKIAVLESKLVDNH